MLKPPYIEAVEAQLRWLRWAQSTGTQMLMTRHGFNKIVTTYEDILRSGDTYCMERQFAALVEDARLDVPDDLAFEHTWMQSKRGFLWVEEPFLVPETTASAEATASGEYVAVPVRIRAVGWREVPEGEWLVPLKGEPWLAPKGCVQFCMFGDGASFPEMARAFAQGDEKEWQIQGRIGQRIEWWPWAYFVLKQGDRLGDRIEQFETLGREENPGGQYVPIEGRLVHPLHEIRWLYVAFHIMAQKLAVVVQHRLDRHTRRRIERNKQRAPEILRVVTLRKLEADRRRDPKGNDVDWQWHWRVKHHWRNQWYPSEGVHRQILIDDYIKGDTSKPFKTPGHTIFVAKR